MAKAAAALAALALAFAAGAGEASIQEVEALSWSASAPGGLDCSAKPWLSEALDAASSGPFKLEMRFSLDPKRLAKSGKSFKLFSFGRTGAGDIEISPEGFISIARTGERRGVGYGLKASAAKPLAILPGEPLELSFQWTGKETFVSCGGERLASFENIGTRNWCVLSAGPFPGKLLSVKIIAR